MHDDDLTPADDTVRIHRVVRDRKILPLRGGWDLFQRDLQDLLKHFQCAQPDMGLVINDTHLIVHRYDAAPNAHAAVQIDRTWDDWLDPDASAGGLRLVREDGHFAQEIRLDGRRSSVVIEAALLLLRIHFRDRLYIESSAHFVDWQVPMFHMMEAVFPGPWVGQRLLDSDGNQLESTPDENEEPTDERNAQERSWRHLLLLEVKAKRVPGKPYYLLLEGIDDRGQRVRIPIFLGSDGFTGHLHLFVAIVRSPQDFAAYTTALEDGPVHTQKVLLKSLRTRLREAAVGWDLALKEQNFDIAKKIAGRLAAVLRGRVFHVRVRIPEPAHGVRFVSDDDPLPVDMSHFDLGAPERSFGNKTVAEHLADWERRRQGGGQ